VVVVASPSGVRARGAWMPVAHGCVGAGCGGGRAENERPWFLKLPTQPTGPPFAPYRHGAAWAVRGALAQR
jgi:hypothetical protein